MWLALTPIVLASAIGFNVLALWLTGCVSRGSSPKAGTPTQTYPRTGDQGNGCQRSARNQRNFVPVPCAPMGLGLGRALPTLPS